MRLSDHLGSTTAITHSTGNLVSEFRYTAWGEVRYMDGSTPTNYTFTRQYSNVTNFGLMYYNARWYDPSLGRFAQADTIVPDGVQGYDRYAYVGNNPVNYADPSGHFGNRGDDKSDYRNRQNERRVHALETRWYAAEMLRRALEEQRNARLASIAHTTDGSALGFEDFRKTLLAPQASAGGPDWGKVATGVALIFTVDFLVVAPIVIGMIAGAPEFEIGMVLSEAWSWPLAGGVVYANVRGFNLIREGFAGPGQP